MKYFTKETDPKIDFEKVDHSALTMLEIARDIAGIPFKITSTYRTPEHSEEVGGFKGDAHTEIPCTAFDIACVDSVSRYRIVNACFYAGFKRIGFNKVHVHVDASLTKPQGVLWLE